LNKTFSVSGGGRPSLRKGLYRPVDHNITRTEKGASEPLEAALLLVHKLHVLDIDSLLHSHSLLDGRLLKVLAGTHLADGSGLLELPLEFLQGPLYVLTLFNRYYNHFGPQR